MAEGRNEKAIEGHTEKNEETNSSVQLESSTWYFKALALACTLLLAAGGHFGSNVVNSLKAKLKSELKIDNTQYGSLDAGLFIVNSFMPLFGGLFMDMFGTDKGSLIATTLTTLGNLIVALGAYSRLFWVMILGRVVFGLGHGCTVVAQEVILSHWFRGRGLSFVIGLSFASSKVFAVAAQGAGASLVYSSASFANPFWLAFGLAALSWIINFSYIFLVKKAERGFNEEEIEKLKEKKKISIKGIFDLPRRFWLLPLINFTIGGVWTPFLQIAPELLKLKFLHDETKAGWYSTISLVFPIALAPITGAFIEIFGFRGIILFTASGLLLVAMSLIRFTYIEPAVALVLYSISIAIGPVSLASSVPLILPKRLTGAAFGFHQSALNAGVSLFAIIAGRIQDRDHGSYDNVLLMFVIQSCVVILLIFAYNFIDFKENKWIWNVNSDKRKAILDENKELEKDGVAKKNILNYIFPAIFVTILVFGLIIYFVYLKV
ncbi:MFS general substrate transporter [Neoconidiobolus thromboides FSU 785]|nr:MFS general substrate transporter [Neoconidiobolus thromboides FSU 785]